MDQEMEIPNRQQPDAGPSAKRTRYKLLPLVLAVAAVCLVLLIVRGIQSRLHAESSLARATEENAVLRVNVVHPKLGAPSEELVLPGNMEPFTDAPIYARTNGYVRRWYVDIGAHVKAGQLLAEIETPEVDQQLSQARAQLATSQSDFKLAKSTAERWQNLRKTDSVAQQETDEKLGDMESKNATMEAARANVRRLEEMQSFQKIYAPFAGVITARNVDIGDLINAGSNGAGKEMFHLAAVRQMRIYVQVPQFNSRSATPGTLAELSVPELPGKTFAGRVVRASDAMDPASRTMRVEVDVDNADGALLPSEYVEVHLKVATPTNSLIVPVNALLFRSEGMSAAIVQGDRVVLQRVVIGRDFGDSLEVISGLAQGDQVVLNPPDSIAAGQKVRLLQAGAQQ
jgi:RND family efflux transporter MFP subunit